MLRDDGISINPLAGERLDGESDKAVLACNDWLRLGIGRSLPALIEKYTQTNQHSPPTTSLGTLKQWSTRNEWRERAIEFDKNWEQRKNAERKTVMEYGLSLDYERVRRLNRLADFLEHQLYATDDEGNYSNLWLQDAKGIGSSLNFERVDIERFNSALLTQYRGVLDDIAKEVGGRVNKTDLTSDGEPIAIQITGVPSRAAPPAAGD